MKGKDVLHAGFGFGPHWTGTASTLIAAERVIVESEQGAGFHFRNGRDAEASSKPFRRPLRHLKGILCPLNRMPRTEAMRYRKAARGDPGIDSFYLESNITLAAQYMKEVACIE
jgi:hypothetical protein